MSQDIRNLGTYANIAALWEAHPEGGREGDYATVSGTRYRWNKYDRIWENGATVTQTTGTRNHVVEGDQEVTGDVTVLGTLRAKHVKQPHMGMYASEEALLAALPTPEKGWYALVGNTLPAELYVCNTDGTWTDTGNEYDGEDVDLTQYVKTSFFQDYANRGYKILGDAVPDTVPSSPSKGDAYLASTAGTYVGFGDVTLEDGQMAMFKYNGSSWSASLLQVGKSYDSDIERLGDNLAQLDQVVEISSYTSPNLFDKSTVTSGKSVRKDSGALYTNSDFCASDYIPVPEGATSLYYSPAQSYSGVIGWAFYNSSKQFTHGGSSYTATPQEGDVYFRFSIRATNLDTTMLVVGTSEDIPSEYIPYGIITTTKFRDDIVENNNIADGAVNQNKLADSSVTAPKIADDSVTINKVAFKVMISPKNILNPALLIAGKWVNEMGGLSNVTPSSYGYYDYIGVAPETDYHISRINNGSVNANGGYIGFYDSNKTFISSVSANGTKDFTTPNGCAFVRISVTLNRLEEAQLEAGSQRTDYEAYFQPYYKIDPSLIELPENGVNAQNIAPGAVTQEKIAAGVMLPPKPEAFSGFKDEETLEAGQMLSLPQVYIKKSIRLVATIFGTIESVEIGVGRTSTYGKYVEVTPTDVIIKVNGNVQSTTPHGLTLGSLTKVLITKGNGGTATIKVIDDYGNVFSTTYTFYAVGTPFIYNGNSADSIGAALSFIPGDLLKSIWIFGDSYLGDNDPARWMYHIVNWGYTGFLLDARSGENASQGLVDLQNLIASGARPSFVCWFHGMNGGADSSGSVNATWLEKTQAVLDLCTAYGITPILATIPTIPAASHAALNNWVRSSGYRYIDFASVVEDANTNYWRGWGTENALLSSDEVHPTSHGAVELAMKALQDFPEITLAD
ncbi:MAG: hypothetical protein IKD95_04615 [Bacteroidales bacterium]|nr:hypothetical protein [Bacteroidales bacterium]